MLKPALAAALVFVVVFGVLRAAEWLYHRLRRTPDWSPHWGSWLFALLLSLYLLVTDLGRA